MKIIVTGGAGFIASHVADAYIKAGHKVAVIDNLLTGTRRNLNKKAKFYEGCAAVCFSFYAEALLPKRKRPTI